MPCGAIDLHEKVILVTGGGSGINLAFAKQALARGAKVLIADLKLTPDGQSFVDDNARDRVVFVECDVSKRAQLQNLIYVSRQHFKTVPDVYIAGAGVFEPPWSSWWDDTEEDSYKQFQINALHPLKLARIAMKALLGEGKKGCVLIVASLAGYSGAFAAPLYCASKHACVGFVRSMPELDRLADIKITAVAPGLVATPMFTADAVQAKKWGYDDSNAVTAEEVADAMMDLVVNDHSGGKCLEVTKSGTRELGVWNIEPPSRAGTGNSADLRENYARLNAIISEERRGVKL